MSEKTNTVTVQENKFNGTSTFYVEGTKNKKQANAAARQFWRDEYDTSPSKIVVEKDKSLPSLNRYKVMVADHSSGSLKQSKEYEF